MDQLDLHPSLCRRMRNRLRSETHNCIMIFGVTDGGSENNDLTPDSKTVLFVVDGNC